MATHCCVMGQCKAQWAESAVREHELEGSLQSDQGGGGSLALLLYEIRLEGCLAAMV